MKVIKRGHIYELESRQVAKEFELDGLNQVVHFVNLEPGHEHPGTTTQEILRMLIDRTTYCNNCLPHRVNEDIIWHFRQALALHEARAIEQKAAKGEILPEFIGLDHDGHFKLDNSTRPTQPLEETVLKPVPPLGKQTCNHRSGE